MAWETKGARSVKNNFAIKQKFSFKNVAKDVLITSQLRTALIINKSVKAANFNIDTINQKIYVFGIAYNENELLKYLDNLQSITEKERIDKKAEQKLLDALYIFINTWTPYMFLLVYIFFNLVDPVYTYIYILYIYLCSG